MSKDHEMSLIFGRSFMATVGAIIDLPNKRVSFSNINKKIFYKAVPTRSQIRYASCISVVSGEQLKKFPKKELGDKSEIKEVLDGDSHTNTKELSVNAKVKEKFQKKRVKGWPTMTLISEKCDEKSIEYEVKCKDTSKPFSKVRAILTHELKEKGEAALSYSVTLAVTKDTHVDLEHPGISHLILQKFLDDQVTLAEQSIIRSSRSFGRYMC
ncbi:hypothetical protein F2Q70_00011631 [Brassica cretica]|uniref:Uncharacterized protein n=1 Tax=Brassica cretica TaxID=69181 RepID=A0A8S9M9Z9_BRACR|nr:hypothetical protein F2Q70_00011631 [Brassica cretica]